MAIWAATLAPSQAGAIKLPDEEYQTDGQIMNDSKYASYFEDCHGALDGIHIDAHVPYEKRTLYFGSNFRSPRTFFGDLKTGRFLISMYFQVGNKSA